MNHLDLLDYCEGQTRRDTGIQIAAENEPDWYALALIGVGEMRSRNQLGESFTFEDVVSALTPFIGKAPNKYVPGSVCMRALRMGLITHTGEYRKASGALKNAHANAVYRWA